MTGSRANRLGILNLANTLMTHSYFSKGRRKKIGCRWKQCAEETVGILL